MSCAVRRGNAYCVPASSTVVISTMESMRKATGQSDPGTVNILTKATGAHPGIVMNGLVPPTYDLLFVRAEVLRSTPEVFLYQ